MLKTVSSITNAIGALNFKGTWNAATNTPTIVSGVGVKGDYFVVGVAGTTTIDGISNWGIGDWIAYNGNIWQRVEGGADLNGVNLSVSGTTTLSGLTASTALALNASKNVVSVTNTGTGNNVLADGPTLTTPTLGVASATSINKVALTGPATGSTLTIADGKTLTANNSLTLVGTDATTMTFPSTNATIARTDAAQTFSGTQTFSADASVNGATVGRGAGNVSTNTAVGPSALAANTTGANNTAVGSGALDANEDGAGNTAVGINSLGACTAGTSNTAIGASSGLVLTTGTNNTLLGRDAGRAGSPFEVTTQSHRVVVGNDEITNAYVQVPWTVTSDARDKTNVAPIPHGLSFVQQLNPVSFQFTKNRESNIPHGNKRYGFLAQDILALEGDDPIIIDNEQPDHLKYHGDSLVPVLVNAIKELKAEIDALKSQLNGA